MLFGIDIGGTKCAVVLGSVDDKGSLSIVDKVCFPTKSVEQTLEELCASLEALAAKNRIAFKDVSAIGISCGGPLCSKKGVILSPPNLPGWDNVEIVSMFEKRFGVKTAIQNDANACALAEWKFGAGRGSQNMVFMTFGTGLGAGLILNGQLYAGTNDNGGELGHIRLSDFGPVGYGKAGSFEGFCSGGGIAQLAKAKVSEKLQMGEKPVLCPSPDQLDGITAQKVAEMANREDELSNEVFAISGEYLGRGLSVIIDILNPEVIVIGSIYARCENLLAKHSNAVIEKEALPLSRKVCRVVPAALGEAIGDMAALSVAANII